MRHGFNGAGVFRPRKFGNGAEQRQPDRGFNGAGVFRPRKCGAVDAAIAALLLLQWGRGLSTPEILLDAAALSLCSTLQWGRGLSTPEIVHHVLEDDPPLLASMGPGSFDPGNASAPLVGTISTDRFNGAGVFRPRKCEPHRQDDQPARASMGPGSFDPGNKANIYESIDQLHASMGPGSFDPGNM